MALKDSENFIKEIINNNDMRTSLYQYDTSAEIMNAIRGQGFQFNLFDFEQSINHLKTESPNEEQAILLGELLLWWNMLMFDGTIAEETMSGGCTPSKCASCSSCV